MTSKPDHRSILQKARAKWAAAAEKPDNAYPTIVHTEYNSLPVDFPADFLGPVSDPSKISVNRVDFKHSVLPEYKSLYAVVLDNLLTKEECNELIRYAEMSVGAHGNHVYHERKFKFGSFKGPREPEDGGWRPAMVNAGRNKEVLAVGYRNSDRIIWDQAEVMGRIWKRCLQVEGIEDYFKVLDGEKYLPAIGNSATRKGEKWACTEQGLNERMRFLRYGPGQFFKEHCDGTYETPDGMQRSFFTFHLYLNDSAQGLNIPVDSSEDRPDLLRGGATTFHSHLGGNERLDIDPRIGRALIFQHRRLLHSGDEVLKGVKFTMRSDLMFQYVETDH